MKVLLSRVKRATVRIIDEPIESSIDYGIVIFVGIEKTDKMEEFKKVVSDIVNLRIFEDDRGKLNKSLMDIKGEVLCIPNFTLCASLKKGKRPSFDLAEDKAEAEVKFNHFFYLLKEIVSYAKCGFFGKEMVIDMEMDGPVNLFLSY